MNIDIMSLNVVNYNSLIQKNIFSYNLFTWQYLDIILVKMDDSNNKKINQFKKSEYQMGNEDNFSTLQSLNDMPHLCYKLTNLSS